MDFHFPTIREFQNYFETNKTLTIPPEGSLSIKNREPLYRVHRSSLEVCEVKNDKDILPLLNDMIASLSTFNRYFIFTQLPEQKTILSSSPDSIKYTFPKGAQLEVHKTEDIFTRVSYLFHRMVVTSCKHLAFGRPVYLVGLKEEILQKVDPLRTDFEDALHRGVDSLFRLIGLKETRDEFSSLQWILQQILKEAACPGVEFFLEGVEKGGYSRQSRSLNSNNEEDYEDCLALIPSNIIHFSVSETYTYSDIDFVKRMHTYPVLNLPAEEKLVISGPSLKGIIESWRKKLDCKTNFFYFILGQLVLPLGKNVVIRVMQPWQPLWSFDQDKGELEICSVSSWIIELTHQGPLYIQLHLLEQQMRSLHIQIFPIPAGVEVIFYDLTLSELANFRNWIASKESEKIYKGVEALFLSRPPYRGEWAIDLNFRIMLTHDNRLFLFNKIDTMLSIVRPKNPAIFALGIIKFYPGLLEAIHNADPIAFFHLLFKSVFYFCCDSPSDPVYDNAIPDYFKPTTKAAIEKTNQDKTFNSHLKAIRKDPNLSERLNKLMMLTPEEFDQLDHSNENESIKYILTIIKGIAFDELEGSPYLQAPIYQFIDYLNSSTTEDATELRDPV